MKKNIYYFLVFLISQIIYGCQKSDESYLDLFSTKQEMQLHPLKDFPIDSLSKPEIIFSSGSHLVFLEPFNDYQLTLYNQTTKKISHILKKGQGPDEVISLQTIGYKYDTDEIYATDLPSQSVLFISDSIKAGCLLHRFKPQINTYFCDVAFDGDLSFFLQTANDKRFLATTADSTFAFGEDIFISGVNPGIVQKSLQGPCVISPDKKRLAWFSVYGDVMQIYDYSCIDDIKCICSNICKLPILSTDDGVMNLKTKLSVASVTSDKDYIYALYNQNSLFDALQNRDQMFFSDKILIFNWNGEAHCVLQLDRPIKSITYDKSQNRILCLGLNDDLSYGVFYFNL